MRGPADGTRLVGFKDLSPYRGPGWCQGNEILVVDGLSAQRSARKRARRPDSYKISGNRPAQGRPIVAYFEPGSSRNRTKKTGDIWLGENADPRITRRVGRGRPRGPCATPIAPLLFLFHLLRVQGKKEVQIGCRESLNKPLGRPRRSIDG